MADDPAWIAGAVQYALRPKSEFRYRNIIECIQYLLRQQAFVDHMLWKPVQLFNTDEKRIYFEMNTGLWWWDQQVCFVVTLNLIYDAAAYLHNINNHSSRINPGSYPFSIASNSPHEFFRRQEIVANCKESAFPVHSLISLVMFIAISSYWELGYRGLRSF